MRATVKLVLVVTTVAAMGCAGPPAERPTGVPDRKPILVKPTMTITSKSPAAVEAVKSGLDFAGNVRMADAIAAYETAVAADPDCALAHALLGALTPGTAGMTHLTKAEELAASLPEAERLYIQSLAAERRGDDARAMQALEAAAAAAPGDWRLVFALGQEAYGRFELDKAAAAMEKAVAIEPTAGEAWNILGYVRLAQRRTDDAIAAFTKYAEVTPGEANPLDSRAEALMAAGRFDEAVAGFEAALAASPAFSAAWAGIAQCRFLQGDWNAGRDALAKARETAVRPVDKLDADLSLAWSHVAEGRIPDALKVLGSVEAMAKEQGLDVSHAFAPLSQARVLIAANKHAQALPLTDEAVARGTAAGLPGGPAGNLLRGSLLTRLEAESGLGKADEARATLAKFEAEMANLVPSPSSQSEVAYARGLAALAAGDTKGAADLMAQCAEDEAYFQLQRARTLAASGDAAGASQVAERLVSFHRRDDIQPWLEIQARQLVTTPAASTN